MSHFHWFGVRRVGDSYDPANPRIKTTIEMILGAEGQEIGLVRATFVRGERATAGKETHAFLCVRFHGLRGNKAVGPRSLQAG